MKRIFSMLLAMLCLMLPLTAVAETASSETSKNENDIYVIGEKLTYKNADTAIPYRLYLPKNYDESKSYPMLVFFHGAGERGDDNEKQLFHNIQYFYDNLPEDCFIVVPQCPLNNQWVDTPWANGAYSVDKVPESNELKAVIELIAELKTKYSVDVNRIYAAGISMGGFATWDVMMRHNDIFAAAIPVCGGGDISKAELLKDTPIFTFHAVNDTAVPVAGTRDTVNAIKNAGGTKIKYTEYTTGGHNIWNQAFATEGLLEKLLDCELYDRYPELKPVESVPESVVESNEESAPEEGFWTTSKLTLLISCVIALVIMVVLYLIKKKK